MLVPLWTLIVAGVVVVALGFTTINLLLKNEKYEDVVQDYRAFFSALNQKVIESDGKLREADQKGLFSSDDEVGSIFTEIRSIHDSLANFFKVDQDAETEKGTPQQ